jgi:hypothetical protein
VSVKFEGRAELDARFEAAQTKGAISKVGANSQHPDPNNADSSVGSAITSTVSTDPVRLEREARILLGWFADDMAQRLLTSQRADVQLTPEQIELLEHARGAVSEIPQINQEGILEPVSSDIADHVSQFLANPAAQPYVQEGWTVGIVDLSRVYALQPSVFVDHVDARTRDVIAEDLASIAAVTLPLPQTDVNLNVQFDQQRQAFMVSSPNPNLRVASGGMFQSPDSGAPMIGFAVQMQPSFVQVAKYQDKYILRDGYHRSVGLLKRGIQRVPCLVHDGMTLNALLPQPAGMLTHEVFAGERPPTIADYWRDEVSATVSLPASHKMVIIQALELGVIG